MTTETVTTNDEEQKFTKGQRLARIDKYDPSYSFHKDLVNIAEMADNMYARIAVSKDRQVNIQLRAALTKLSVAADWYIHVMSKDIVSYE